MAAIAGGTAPTGTVIEAVPPSGGDGFPFAGLLDAAKAGDTGTRAYLNILLFDEALGFLDAAYVTVSMAAREDGTNVPHEKLSGEIVVQQPGYAYIYFSNDNGQPLEVFFDDFTVTHSHSAIVQADDYYPFGLTFNSYRRELGKFNEYLYQSKERPEALGWDDFHARMYSPALGRFFGVDPKDQFVSPFVGMGNNPIIGVDPDGEFVFSLISKLVSGDINNAGDFFRTIFTGSITDAFNSVATLNPINILSRDIGVVTGLWNGVFNGNWERLGNTGEIFLGQFYTDNNRSVSSEIWQGISRNTTEHTQTTVGYNYSQWRNTVGKVDRVDLFAGATFVTGENQEKRKGVSLGNFLNINIDDEITGSFEERIVGNPDLGIPADPLFMHEYGHTFDSQNFGPLYLYAIGVPSAISASRARRVPGEPQGVTTHDFRWYEMSANRHASRYFGMYHGVDWNTAPWGFGATYETFFPRRRR